MSVTDPQYVINSAGERTAVILPVETYEALLEDIEDLATLAKRHDEPTDSHETVVAALKSDGLL